MGFSVPVFRHPGLCLITSLDCKYGSAETELRLRTRMSGPAPKAVERGK